MPGTAELLAKPRTTCVSAAFLAAARIYAAEKRRAGFVEISIFADSGFNAAWILAQWRAIAAAGEALFAGDTRPCDTEA